MVKYYVIILFDWNLDFYINKIIIIDLYISNKEILII